MTSHKFTFFSIFDLKNSLNIKKKYVVRMWHSTVSWNKKTFSFNTKFARVMELWIKITAIYDNSICRDSFWSGNCYRIWVGRPGGQGDGRAETLLEPANNGLRSRKNAIYEPLASHVAGQFAWVLAPPVCKLRLVRPLYRRFPLAWQTPQYNIDPKNVEKSPLSDFSQPVG